MRLYCISSLLTFCTQAEPPVQKSTSYCSMYCFSRHGGRKERSKVGTVAGLGLITSRTAPEDAFLTDSLAFIRSTTWSSLVVLGFKATSYPLLVTSIIRPNAAREDKTKRSCSAAIPLVRVFSLKVGLLSCFFSHLLYDMISNFSVSTGSTRC